MARSIKIARCDDCGQIEIIYGRGRCKVCAKYFYRTGQSRRPGVGGCGEGKCIKWETCKAEQQQGYTGPLPCEEIWPEDDPELYELPDGLTAWPAVDVGAVVWLRVES